MKITVIHGQNHKGNTYMIAHELAEKIGGEVTEFFLPRDFDEPCLGCWTCFNKDLHIARIIRSSSLLWMRWMRRMW